MESVLIEVLTIELASLALFAVLAAVFWQVILFPVPAAKLIDLLRKFVTQMEEGRLTILCGIILTRRQAASSSSKILRILATPPIATAFNTIRHYFSTFVLAADATLAIAHTIQATHVLDFVRARSLQTVTVDAFISKSGVEIYPDRSKYALN